MKAKNIIFKIPSFVLCFAMLLALLFLTVMAKDEQYTPVEWQLDSELTYIYGGEKRYERYYVRGAFYGDADSAFYFKNHAIYDGKTYQVYGESADPHIVSVMTADAYSYIFVDAEGKAILDAFLDRTDCVYYLEKFDEVYTKINASMVDSLDASYSRKGAKLKSVDVAELGEADIYELTVHDKTETKAFQHGAIYLMPDQSYYYVCFEELDNSYFDADGYFSYRSGSVKVYELDEAERLRIDGSIAQMETKQHQIIYEENVVKGLYDVNGNPIDRTDDPSYSKGALIVFFAITILVGFLAPATLLILGLVWATRQRYWYTLVASATLWLLSSTLFLLFVLL